MTDNKYQEEKPIVAVAGIDIDDKYEEAKFEQNKGSLYADCIGECGSTLSKFINAIFTKSADSMEMEDLIAIMEQYFYYHDYKLRKYLFKLMQKMRCNEDNERQFMQDLQNPEKIMVTKEWVITFKTIFTQLTCSNNKAQVLQKLAQNACERPPSIQVLDEVCRNFETENSTLIISKSKIHESVVNCKKLNEFQVMIQADYPLTNNELIALILYTKYEDISGAFRKVNRESNNKNKPKISCKWRQLYSNLGSAIKKLHRVFVCGKTPTALPSKLYHGLACAIKANDLAQLQFRTISSFTTEKSVAALFAFQDGSGSIIELCGIQNALSTGDLIAASVGWISPHDEYEWCLLPIDFINAKQVKSYKGVIKKYRVKQFQSKSFIPSDDIDDYTAPIATYLEFPTEKERQALDHALGIGVVVGSFTALSCTHCKIRSRLIDYWGDLYKGTAECCCCRKYVLGHAQDDYQDVICFGCNKTSRKLQWKFPSEIAIQKEQEHDEDDFKYDDNIVPAAQVKADSRKPRRARYGRGFNNGDYNNNPNNINGEDLIDPKDLNGVLCPHCKAPWKVTLREHKMKNETYRRNRRNGFRKFLSNNARKALNLHLTPEQIEQTCFQLIPEHYDPANKDTDAFQLIFGNDKLRIETIVLALMETDFGKALFKSNKRFIVQRLLSHLGIDAGILSLIGIDLGVSGTNSSDGSNDDAGSMESVD